MLKQMNSQCTRCVCVKGCFCGGGAEVVHTHFHGYLYISEPLIFCSLWKTSGYLLSDLLLLCVFPVLAPVTVVPLATNWIKSKALDLTKILHLIPSQKALHRHLFKFFTSAHPLLRFVPHRGEPVINYRTEFMTPQIWISPLIELKYKVHFRFLIALQQFPTQSTAINALLVGHSSCT